MKVALLGNSNNMFFSLARHLRDRGVDAHLFIFESEKKHFLPDCDTFTDDYKSYTTLLSWGSVSSFFKQSPKIVANDLAGFDCIIGCGSAPAFLHRMGRVLDIFIPFGGDLVNLTRPDWRFSNPRRMVRSFFFARHQKAGIRSAKYFTMGAQDRATEAVIQNMGLTGQRVPIFSPMVFTKEFNPETIKEYYSRSEWYKNFKDIREKNEVMVFYHSRHIWKTSPDVFSHKGTDSLIYGFAAFVKQTPGVRSCLVTCAYGQDVESSKILIRTLGIEDRVHWFPIIPRKEIMVGLSLCDLACGQFRTGAFYCGTIFEVMTMGKPLLHFRDDAFHGCHPNPYPLVNVQNPEEITAAFVDYTRRPEHYKSIGQEGLLWLNQYAVDNPMNEYMKMIHETSNH